MKAWHLEHAKKAIIRFAVGLSADTSKFEKRNYRKYGTIAGCINQLEYDMRHGVQKRELMEIIRKIGLNKKYASIRSDPDALARLKELEELLSGVSHEDERLAWHDHAHREQVKNGA